MNFYKFAAAVAAEVNNEMYKKADFLSDIKSFFGVPEKKKEDVLLDKLKASGAAFGLGAAGTAGGLASYDYSKQNLGFRRTISANKQAINGLLKPFGGDVKVLRNQYNDAKNYYKKQFKPFADARSKVERADRIAPHSFNDMQKSKMPAESWASLKQKRVKAMQDMASFNKLLSTATPGSEEFIKYTRGLEDAKKSFDFADKYVNKELDSMLKARNDYYSLMKGKEEGLAEMKKLKQLASEASARHSELEKVRKQIIGHRKSMIKARSGLSHLNFGNILKSKLGLGLGAGLAIGAPTFFMYGNKN